METGCKKLPSTWTSCNQKEINCLPFGEVAVEHSAAAAWLSEWPQRAPEPSLPWIHWLCAGSRHDKGHWGSRSWIWGYLSHSDGFGLQIRGHFWKVKKNSHCQKAIKTATQRLPKTTEPVGFINAFLYKVKSPWPRFLKDDLLVRFLSSSSEAELHVLSYLNRKQGSEFAPLELYLWRGLPSFLPCKIFLKLSLFFPLKTVRSR